MSYNRRYRMYSRNKFNNWRDRVKKHLPRLAEKVFRHDGYVPYEVYTRLRKVITYIHDPLYNANVSYLEEVSGEVALEMMVDDLFRMTSKYLNHPIKYALACTVQNEAAMSIPEGHITRETMHRLVDNLPISELSKMFVIHTIL